jgi:Protochlamydia outer membrane protein
LIKNLSWLLALSLVVGHAAAQMESDGRLQVRLSTGYERQDFHWSIAGNSAGQDPNVYSELKWRGISGPTGRLDLNWDVCRRWRIFATGSRVFSRGGSMTDSDYGLDNRNDQIYHQQFNASGGYSEGVAAGVGYSLLVSGPFRLTPFIGYSIDAQYFPITDPGGPYSQLNSNYSAKWLGPLVKMDAAWQVVKGWQVVAAVTYHQVNYRGKADWNLISTFAHPVSFRHTADGYGVEAAAGLRYRAGRRVFVNMGAGYFNWQTGTGIDQLYLSAGGSQQTQLNGVLREGWRGMLGAELGLF